jgi:predicted RNase H-like HicB family nuclease
MTPIKKRTGGMMVKKQKHAFQVIIEQDEDGYYVAECPALKACYTQGRTYEEVMENIKDVIEMCLEDLKAKRQKVPQSAEIIGIRRLEVSV